VSAARRHRKRDHEEEHENHERWLVSGYDMMTLLFAVFVVLFAISSTNISKVKELQQSLQEAFSGPVLSGGKAMMKEGDQSKAENSPPEPPLPTLTPKEAVVDAMRTTAISAADSRRAAADAHAAAATAADLAAQEQRDFEALKRRIDKLVRDAGLSRKVSTTVTPRGLKIRLLTDRLFFDSGSAVVNAAAIPTLDAIGGIIAEEAKHPVEVEGHTDDRPIATSQYPSNWQLSGARAGAVVQRLIGTGVGGRRVSLAGYAAQRPVAPNGSHRGRARNRRVEIVLTRLHGAEPSQGADQP
jgi:chemotaxis protein MotB